MDLPSTIFVCFQNADHDSQLRLNKADALILACLAQKKMMIKKETSSSNCFIQFYNIVLILEAVLVLVYSLARKLCTYAVVAFQMDPGIDCLR